MEVVVAAITVLPVAPDDAFICMVLNRTRNPSDDIHARDSLSFSNKALAYKSTVFFSKKIIVYLIIKMIVFLLLFLKDLN